VSILAPESVVSKQQPALASYAVGQESGYANINIGNAARRGHVHYLPRDSRSAPSLASPGLSAVSAPDSLTGTLETLGVLEENGQTRMEYSLNVGDRQVPLVINDTMGDYLSGSIVTARGKMGPDGLDVPPGGITVQESPVDDGTPHGPGPNRFILEINMNFSDDLRQPWSESTANNVFNNQVASWFYEGSFGRVVTSTDVTPWVTIPSRSSPCATNTWATQAQAAVRALAYDPASYTHVVFAFPRSSACGFSGLGQVPGRFTWLNGAMSRGVATHELGHNLGLSHSRYRFCSDLPLGTSCSQTEYGDRFDVMGSGGAAHYHGAYRNALGWIPNSDVVTVRPADGFATVALSPAEFPDGSGTRLLRIGRTGRSDFLYVETRAAIGFDSVLGQFPALANGVAVYTGTARNQSIVDVYQNGTGRAASAPLQYGDTLYDYIGDVAITPYQDPDGNTLVDVVYGLG
jgi:hypothetical protein